MSGETIPRRIRLDKLTPAEKAIYDAVQLIESMPADVRLTDAVNLLEQARNKVADYVDSAQMEVPISAEYETHAPGSCPM